MMHRMAVVAFAASLVAAVAGHSAPQSGQPASQSPTAAIVPTAETQFKNVQVLTDIPASELMPTMHFIRASLGVRCDFCHITDNNRYDLDAKSTKTRAREMIRMVTNINRGNFGARPVVTCNSCHRGRTQPIGVPDVAQGRFSDTTRGSDAAVVFPTAATILDRYLEALGGRKALESVRRRVSKGVLLRMKVENAGTPAARAVNRGQEDPLEIIQEVTGFLTVKIGAAPAEVVQDLIGNSGTVSTPNGKRVMSPQEVTRLSSELDLRKELLLREQAETMQVLGEQEVDGLPAYVVQGRTAGSKRALWFFDATSGLLLRRIVYTPLTLGDDPEQTDYEDYREVNGIKLPFAVRTSYLDDNHLGVTRRFSEIENVR